MMCMVVKARFAGVVLQCTIHHLRKVSGTAEDTVEGVFKPCKIDHSGFGRGSRDPCAFIINIKIKLAPRLVSVWARSNIRPAGFANHRLRQRNQKSLISVEMTRLIAILRLYGRYLYRTRPWQGMGQATDLTCLIRSLPARDFLITFFRACRAWRQSGHNTATRRREKRKEKKRKKRAFRLSRFDLATSSSLSEMASVAVLPALPQKWAAPPDSSTVQTLARESQSLMHGSSRALLLTPGILPHHQPSFNVNSSPLDPPTSHTRVAHCTTSLLMRTTS